MKQVCLIFLLSFCFNVTAMAKDLTCYYLGKGDGPFPDLQGPPEVIDGYKTLARGKFNGALFELYSDEHTLHLVAFDAKTKKKLAHTTTDSGVEGIYLSFGEHSVDCL